MEVYKGVKQRYIKNKHISHSSEDEKKKKMANSRDIPELKLERTGDRQMD